MKYKYLCASENGFVQQLAVAYVNHGYWFYVTGTIPNNKNAVLVDRKLIEKYNIAISKWARARRKLQGLANVQYLRHRQRFILIATRGKHEFFEQEGDTVKDIRREPLLYAGYSIGYHQGVDRKWHASVRIHPEQYRLIRDYFLGVGVHRSVERIRRELQLMPFEPYAPVRRQMLNILRAMNRRRRTAGLEPVGIEAVRLRRRILKPFLDEEDRTLEIERCTDISPLRENDFSEELSTYRQPERGPRNFRRGIQR